MSGAAVLRMKIKSSAEMGFVGGAFGGKFVQPLVESDDPDINSLVVTMYGTSGIGKTTFAQNACKPFSAFYRSLRRAPEQMTLRPIVVKEGKRLLRWKDFAPNGWLADDLKGRFMPPRPKDADRAMPVPGLDILEHAPMLYLNSAQAVVLLGSRSAHDIAYFEEAGSESFYPKTVEQSSRNVRAKEIAAELRQMVCFQDGPPPRKVPGAERYATLILATENEKAREAFANFKQAVAAYAL